jgi:hypothetical protein
LYATKSKLRLSDAVHTTTLVCDQQVKGSWESTGIFYENDKNRRLIGYLDDDDNHLQTYWKIHKHFRSKSDVWEWNIAIQDVLSIWFGQTIWLLKREFTRDAQKITEVRQKDDLSDLGLLSPFRGISFDKDAFIKMVDFFVENSSEAEICRRIFAQITDASNQRSRQAQEILVSTTLEAALRCVDKRPFTPKKDSSWNVDKGLKNFFSAYFPAQEWNDIRKRVMIEHCYLRDRNAHPDWLFSQGGSLSESEQAKSLDSMIFLSRFYGYIILALVGFEGLVPEFPKSHMAWSPAAIITTISGADSPDNSTADLHSPGVMSGFDELNRQLYEAVTYHQKIMIWRNFYRGIK